MRCQRQILRVKWQDMIHNTAIAEKTGLPSVTAVNDARQTVLFGHVARFNDGEPTRGPLSLAIYRRSLRQATVTVLKRPRGRPRDTWLKPFLHSNIPIKECWDAAVGRGHGPSAQRSSLNT